MNNKNEKELMNYSLIELWIFEKAAFTLAEVLITLGIIGIVAAMTLPALIQKNQDREIISRTKKFMRI